MFRRPIVLRTTVFPPAFGPVITTTLSLFNSKLSGTVFCLPNFFINSGCLASEINIGLLLSICGSDPIISVEYLALAKIESIYGDCRE